MALVSRVFYLRTFNTHYQCISSASMSSSKPKVFVSKSSYPRRGIDLLKEKCEVEEWTGGVLTQEELCRRVAGVDAVFVSAPDKVTKQLISSAGKLKVVGTMSVGVDHVDLRAMKEAGVRLGYTPGVLTEATAELTLALLLATSRNVFPASHALRTGGWGGWDPSWMCGPGLEGATVGIVGFGRIGQSIGRKVKGFSVSNILYSSQQDKQAGLELGAERTTFDSLLERSDFVVASCALADNTRGLFNKQAFSKMKKSAIFINISRGGVVVQDDLVEALKTGEIRAAGLDVMTPEPLPLDSPLLSLDNCVLLPHIGSATHLARENMSVMTAKNILAALDQQPMPAEYPL